MRWVNIQISCVALGAAVIVVSGCSDGERGAAADVAPSQSPLEIPIFDCQAKHATCLSSAQDPSAATGCQDELKQCLVDAGPKLAELAEGVLACKDKAVECAGKGDPSAAATCRDEFIACVGVDFPGLPGRDDDAGVPPHAPPPGAPHGGGGPTPPLPPPPPAAGAPGAPGAPPSAPPGVPPIAPPGLPPHVGSGAPPGLPGWPDAGIPAPGDVPGAACIEDLFACLSAGTDPMECANQARECVQKEVPGAPDWAAAGAPGSPQGGPGPQPKPGEKRGG